ncbi:MAG: VWA domain-containing protein [Clostridiales bacterium]|nr:VWA domain-containing protein [Clostridiales bacterium]
MKKRILSLVLCAAMLLSMCLFLGAGVAEDTTADGSAESTETVDGVNIVSFTNAGPLVTPEQTVGPARVRARAANDTGSGVKLDKTVTKDENSDTYTVRLEAYATGEQTTTVSTKPCDIVLVLDVSGSMDEDLGSVSKTAADKELGQIEGYYYYYDGWNRYDIRYNPQTSQWEAKDNWVQTGIFSWQGYYDWQTCSETTFYYSKLSALKSAVNTFIEEVAKKETATVKHNISIVKFAGDSTKKVGNKTYYEDGYEYNYSQIVMNLMDASDKQKDLMDAVNNLKAGGATRADYGMQHAQSILSNRSADREDATKVVVMFTDGEPTSFQDFDTTVANGAIDAAKSLKAGGATVYTVGCMDGANGTPVTDINGVSKVNKYMHLVSSNYKNATKMDDPGAATYPENKNESYYLTAKTAAELENAFESINKQIGGSKTDLTSTAVLKDAVTPYFEIPADAKVTLKTADYGKKDDGTPGFLNEKTITGDSVEATVKDNTVSVTGFDYSANWCGPRTNAAGSTTYSGKKLIVEFTIQPTAAFLGGNGVQTNVGTTDGIYAPGETTPVEKFQPQQVDVTVKAVEPKTTGTEIYLGEKTDLADRVTTNIPLLDGTNNAYVDVTYTVKDENGTVVGTYTVPAEKTSGEGTWEWTNGSNVKPDKTTTYTVTSTSTPKTGDETNTASVEKQFTIKVNTCSLTISKTVTSDGANPNQTFVFDVEDSTGKVVTTIVLKDGEQKVITGLAVGTYTVEEDANWSWSFKADNAKQTVTLGRANTETNVKPTATVSVVNTFTQPNWLTSIADVINKWETKDGTAAITPIWPKN